MQKLAEISPEQQEIRRSKKNWNKAFQEFRRRLQALSKGLNGRGDLKYNLPPTDIKEPLPDQLNSFISQLVNNFHQLTDAAELIEEKQKQYSESIHKDQSPKIATAAKHNKVVLGNNEFETLVARTEEEQARGLMFVEYPPPVMSFVYSSPRVNRFWMKQTPSPLDIVFSLNGKITAIYKGEPFSTKLIGDYAESDLIVELPFGTCAKLGIKSGDNIFLK